MSTHRSRGILRPLLSGPYLSWSPRQSQVRYVVRLIWGQSRVRGLGSDLGSPPISKIRNALTPKP